MSHQNYEEAMHDEDSSDDGGLWNEFENCATSVTHLYRNANWRTLQSAAASTTQLYKHGLELKKRSYDRGLSKGRVALAREISSMCRFKNKVDVADIVALLSKYDLLPPADRPSQGPPGGGQSPRQLARQQREQLGGGGGANSIGETGGGVGNPNAVFLFQEALAPVANPTASPMRNGQLGNFLQNQVYRHRKRQHSPSTGGSPCGHAFEYVSKRLKRL